MIQYEFEDSIQTDEIDIYIYVLFRVWVQTEQTQSNFVSFGFG